MFYCGIRHATQNYWYQQDAKGTWKCLWHQRVPFTPQLCWLSCPFAWTWTAKQKGLFCSPTAGLQANHALLALLLPLSAPTGQEQIPAAPGKWGNTLSSQGEAVTPGRWLCWGVAPKPWIIQTLCPSGPNVISFSSLTPRMSNYPLLKIFPELTELQKVSLIECHY